MATARGVGTARGEVVMLLESVDNVVVVVEIVEELVDVVVELLCSCSSPSLQQELWKSLAGRWALGKARGDVEGVVMMLEWPSDARGPRGRRGDRKQAGIDTENKHD